MLRIENDVIMVGADVLQRRVARILGQRQADLTAALTTNPQGTLRPAEVNQPQVEHVTGPEAKT